MRIERLHDAARLGLLATCQVDEIDPDHRPPYRSIITRAGQEPPPAAFEDRLKTAWCGILGTHSGKDIGYTEVPAFKGFGT